MTTSMTNDSRCTTCNKAAGTFTCRGCSKDFCLRHTNEHRQGLIRQMDEEVIPLHDQLQQNFDEHITNPDCHLLMKRIDEWEQISIEKIHKAANDARKELIKSIDNHTSKMKEMLSHLTQQLKKARDDDQFFETDLTRWINELSGLKKDFDKPQTINIHYDNERTSFISKIVIIDQMSDIFDERFETFLGDIQIASNGTVITHNQKNTYASVRGSREYLFGKHRLRFLIKKLDTTKWAFFGIVSKNAPIPISPSVGKTAYGFSGENNIWRDGSPFDRLDGYRSDFHTDDQIELIINCNERKLRLMNERTQEIYFLDVDINKCPLPWKLNVGFNDSPGECIRILPSSYSMLII